MRTVKDQKYALYRGSNDYGMAIANMSFFLYKHINDKDDNIFNSEIYHRLNKELIQTCFNKWSLESGVIINTTGSNTTINQAKKLNFDSLYKNRQFEHYTDFICKTYPEKHHTSIKEYESTSSLNKVLTRSFTFQVTDACNLACTYCYQINKNTRRMSFETAKLAVDKLLSGADGFGGYINPDISPGIVLEFIGGEPFLEIELIDKIVDYFREQAIKLDHPWSKLFRLSLCSNGVLYKDPRVQKFLQKNQEFLSFSVTVDGTQELHDACRVFPDGSPSYHLAHSAAIDWMNRGYYMGSKITIAPDNVEYLADSLLQMVKDGYYELNANCVFEEGWTLEHAQELYKQCKKFADEFHKNYDLEKYKITLLSSGLNSPRMVTNIVNWCGGTGSMLAMDPDGDLYPCIRYMDSSLGGQQKPVIIGNVFEGLLKRQCYKDCFKCIVETDRRTQSTDQCFYCPIANECGWCSGYNYQVYGTTNKRATYICEMHKARCLASAYFYNNYYKKHAINKAVDLWVPRQWAIPIIGEEEYNNLASLTKELGGYVNEDATMVKMTKSLEALREENFSTLEKLSDK